MRWKIEVNNFHGKPVYAHTRVLSRDVISNNGY